MKKSGSSQSLPSTDQLRKWLSSPENKSTLDELLRQSLKNATQTSDYIREKQKIEQKKLLEPITL